MSLFKHYSALPASLKSLTISSGVSLSYLLLYTAYDKTKKQLELKNLTDLVTLNRGLDWTLVEINKALSLTGLTTLLLSFLPQFEGEQKDLLFSSIGMLWVHTVYSSYKFYSLSLQRLLKEKTIKKLSVALGVAGQAALIAGFWGYISYPALVLSGVTLGISHFYTMEIDYKGVLQVRPYAYLPFPLGGLVLYYLGQTYYQGKK